ncbi:MAG: aa3-type cytochrome c oxidase subunit IV [Pseudomonadota bacterium]
MAEATHGSGSTDTSEGSDNAMDYNEHNKSFDVFVNIVKWSTIITITVLILMAIFLL